MKKLLIGVMIMILMVSLYSQEKKGGGYYIVPQQGDSLWKIANSNYGVATKTIYKAIQAANEDKIKSINYLKPGVKIYLPTKEEINKYSLLVLAQSEKTVVAKKNYSVPKVYTPKASVSGVKRIIKPKKKVSK